MLTITTSPTVAKLVCTKANKNKLDTNDNSIKSYNVMKSYN